MTIVEMIKLFNSFSKGVRYVDKQDHPRSDKIDRILAFSSDDSPEIIVYNCNEFHFYIAELTVHSHQEDIKSTITHSTDEVSIDDIIRINQPIKFTKIKDESNAGFLLRIIEDAKNTKRKNMKVNTIELLTYELAPEISVIYYSKGT